MGRDINMSMFTPDKRKVESFKFWDDGARNYSWFDNISGNGYFFKYENFPMDYLWDKDKRTPAEIQDIIDNRESYGAYDFRILNVGDFISWYEKMKPYRRAGYVNEYTRWKLNEGWTFADPDDVPTYKTENANIFMEFNYYDPSTELYNYLIDNNFPKENNIFYYFDC